MAERIGASGLRRVEIERACAILGRTLSDRMLPGMGFAFLLFDFGTAGNLAYISNSRREDMIAALRELIARLEAEVQ